MVGNRARESLIGVEGRAPRLLPTLQEPSNQKKIGPCFAALGQGVASFFSSSVPSRRGGRRADKAHCPDYSGRVSGLLRTTGVKRHAPRLAARQRGILAFMPLTVVG